MDNFIVYIHIRPDINEPFYVGMGIIGRDLSLAGRNQYWKNIVNKNNGIFKSEILFRELSQEDALLKERETEIYLQTQGYKLTNIIECGIKGRPVGLNHSDETIKKMSDFWLNYYISNPSPKKEIKMSKESSLKKSKSMIGKKVRLGIKDSEETKQKKSEAFKGRIYSEESKQKKNEKLKDKTIYNFHNILTKENFKGSRHEFIHQYNIEPCQLSSLITGKLNKYKNWIKI
jgi:hypothetical protein